MLINPAMCQGCGECATVCPNSAAVLEGYREEQVLNMIDAALME
jgi:heterodisulfide reductase subunit A